MSLSVFLPFQKGGTLIFKISKGGDLKTNFGVGETKRGGERFSKIKGGTRFFKLNLGIEMNTNDDF